MSARETWTSSSMPAVIVPATIGADLAAETRARLDALGFARFTLLDRGSYEYIDDPPVDDVVTALRGVAEAITNRGGDVATVRALRLRPGDYLLTRHDRVYDDRPLELVLDLSPAAVGGAEVHWRHRGQVYFTMPAAPGTLAIIERGPTVMCNHTYVSKRQDASVVRLVVMLVTRASRGRDR